MGAVLDGGTSAHETRAVDTGLAVAAAAAVAKAAAPLHHLAEGMRRLLHAIAHL